MKPTEPNDAKMMKITAKDKEFLLSQVQIILSECQRLVFQLSSVQCQEDSDFAKCPDVKSSPDDDVSSVTSKQSYNLLWDTSEDFPVYSATPSVYYNLAFPDESFEDETISNLEYCQIPKKSFAEKCSFVSKINDFISSSFPNNVFTQEKSAQLRQERLNESVFIDFQPMWNNVDDLFVQIQDDTSVCTTATSAPEIVYKTIDFSKVNVRNMSNIPKPNYFPIHGVLNDPEFYKKTYWVKGFEYEKKEINYFKPSPHGSIYGYQTNDGIVPVPDVPVHGHVWSDHLHNWVLHAVYPEERPAARAPWTGPGPPTRRRPPSTRRGWPTSRSGGRK